MRIVEDAQGRQFIVLKRSTDTTLVQDLITGEQSYRRNTMLSTVTEIEEKSSTALDLPERFDNHRIDPDTWEIFLLSLEHSPIAITSLLDRTERCESDVHAMLNELCAVEYIERFTDTLGRPSVRPAQTND